jgi:hypothetical protein
LRGAGNPLLPPSGDDQPLERGILVASQRAPIPRALSITARSARRSAGGWRRRVRAVELGAGSAAAEGTALSGERAEWRARWRRRSSSSAVTAEETAISNAAAASIQPGIDAATPRLSG